MPRSGWLAVGAVGAAIAASVLGAAAVGASAMVGAALLFAAIWSPTARRISLAAAVGLAAVAIRSTTGPAPDGLAGVPEGRGPWVMVVETVGSPREGHQVATLRTATAGPIGFRVAATLPRYPGVEPGDEVTVEGRVRPRPESPYGAYLERLGAWGSLDADTLTITDSGDGPGRVLERLRRSAAEALTVTLPEPEAGLAAGILIGLRDRVDREVAAAFTTAGVSHVVAISGWNIAIVAAAIASVAGRLGRRRRAIVTIVAIAAYIAFAGASPSVLRAGAMAGVVLLARETGRAGYAAAALGWAVTLLLVVDPGLIGDAGFQLSTVATAGLIAWATPLTERIDRVGRGRLPRWLTESLGVSLAAQAATLPIVLVSFGRLALVAPVINLVVVPLVAPVMAAGIVALLAGAAVAAGSPPALGAILAAPAWVSLRLMISLVEAAATLPLASVRLDPPFGTLAAAMFVTFVGALIWRRRVRRPDAAAARAAPPLAATGRPVRASPMVVRAATIAMVVAVSVTGGVIAVRPPGVARVTVLDVGQGDAILVEGSDGGRLLVDGGPDPDRLLVALDRHLPPWDRRLDAVILSHPHEDHVAGLALLLDRYRVGRVFEPGMRGPGPGYAAWMERLARGGAPTRLALATGDRLAIDDIRLRVLWPDRGTVPAEPADAGTGINNVSVVLLGEIGDRRFLLTGDIEEEIDPVVLARGIPRVDLLKVAHHGSRTATTAPFVAATDPDVAIASAGADNTYGHPARSTLDRLVASGARVYRTDRDGAVTVTFERERMTIRTRPRSLAERRIDAQRTAVGTATPSPPSVAATPARSFLCAVPAAIGAVSGLTRPAIPPPAPVAAAARAEAARAAAAPTPDADGTDRLDRRLGYHRGDDGLLVGGDRPPALPGTAVMGGRGRARRGRAGGMTAPIRYIYGDDDLTAARLIDDLERDLVAAHGMPLERWGLVGDLTTAATGAAQLRERLATAVLFGGGTLAIVSKPGALVRRNDTRDTVLDAIANMAPGNALVFVEETRANAKGPGPKRLSDAVLAAGGQMMPAMAPRPAAIGAWIETEARRRGLTLAPGAAREIADRLGARVTDGDVDRRYVTRIASGELDKLTLRHAVDGGPVTVDDVRALVAESTPGSVWALTDAVGERRGTAALTAIDRLIETTPEPVLLAVLHRRIVELLELGDRLADGAALPVAARAMGITSEFRAKALATQTRRWSTPELASALAGLVELDAMVKGAPGSELDAAQRRLAFTMWVQEHASVGG